MGTERTAKFSSLKYVVVICAILAACTFLRPSDVSAITMAEVLQYFEDLQANNPNGDYTMEVVEIPGTCGPNALIGIDDFNCTPPVTKVYIWLTPPYAVMEDTVVLTDKVFRMYSPEWQCTFYEWYWTETYAFTYCDGSGGIEETYNYPKEDGCYSASGEKDVFACVSHPYYGHHELGRVIGGAATWEEAWAICQPLCAERQLVAEFIITECYNSCCDTNTQVASSANYASGNLYDTREIVPAIGTKLPISFSLAYNSLDRDAGPLGKGWTHNYHMRIKIKTASDPYLTLIEEGGKKTIYANAGSGVYHPVQISGDHSTIVYDGTNGQYLLTRKDGTVYVFDSTRGKLRSIRDRNNNTVDLTYTPYYFVGTDPAGYVTSITDSTGRAISLTYDSQGRIIAIADPAGRATHLAYDTGGSLSSITDAAGNSWQYAYDTTGKMATKTDPVGNVTTYTYDAQWRLTAATTPAGTKSIAYGTNNTVTITERDGSVWTYKYKENPTVPLEVTGPNNAKTTSVYDYSRNLRSRTDPKGNTTSYTYDSDGNMLTMTDALNNTTTYTYNQWGQVTSITDPAGNITSHIYDANGNLMEMTDPSGAVTQYQHDARGNITSVITAAGQVTIMTYDQYGNPASVTDPTGIASTFTYDISGNMTSQSDALGNVTTFAYNILNQLVNVTDQQGHATTYTYDAKGNRTSVTDAKGNVTYYGYSYNNQPVTVTDPLGNTTTYSYGGTGCQSCGGGTDKLASVTDANNHIIQYAYDSSGRLISMTDQLGNIETYTYDLNGNLLTLTDRKGQTTSYTYDSLNRMTQATYADGSYTTYAYDATGKVTTITDSVSGTISYAYSTATSGGPVGRVINETTPEGSISYSYDAIGRRTSMTVAGQPTVNYTYDADNRLTDINTMVNGVAADFSMSYDVLGRRTQITFPNGVTTNYTYDNLSRLQNLQHLNPVTQTLESLTYTYDANGNRTSMDRLSGTLLRPNPVSATSYNEANQMLTFNDKNITYDANGNMISVMNSCGTTTYTWDARNRLTGINGFTSTCSSVSASFRYDALGQRIEKAINGRTIKYFYDGRDIVQEIENSVPSVNFIRTTNIDEPLARIQCNGTVRYYQADALGSIIALTDETGAIRTQYTYDAFGKVTVSGEASDNPFQYTGRENDGTGLYYYRARYYNPELQRFISEDPIGLKGGINFFSYVENNPVSYTDALGLKKGCGPFGIALPVYREIHSCCVNHDDCYDGCKSKCGCDKEFCDCMKRNCNTLPLEKRVRCLKIAEDFCGAVKGLGSFAYLPSCGRLW